MKTNAAYLRSEPSVTSKGVCIHQNYADPLGDILLCSRKIESCLLFQLHASLQKRLTRI